MKDRFQGLDEALKAKIKGLTRREIKLMMDIYASLAKSLGRSVEEMERERLHRSYGRN